MRGSPHHPRISSSATSISFGSEVAAIEFDPALEPTASHVDPHMLEDDAWVAPVTDQDAEVKRVSSRKRKVVDDVSSSTTAAQLLQDAAISPAPSAACTCAPHLPAV